jgi:hypothetical protein
LWRNSRFVSQAPDLSANRPSSSHYSHVKAPSCSDVVQSSEVFPSTDLEARLPQSVDHIQQRTRTPGGPPRRVFHQALVFSPVNPTHELTQSLQVEIGFGVLLVRRVDADGKR